ncbi:MAG TPA: hypothetical protein VF139_19320 [Candidatus Polarisedimenticolaceae bacterium]
MSRTAKIVGVTALVLAVLFAGGVTWAAVATWQAGAIRVRIQDHRAGGTDVALVLPAVALDAALAVIPDHARAEIELDAEAGPILSVLENLCDDLEGHGDFVLIEADHQNERVRVETKDGFLRVSVESAEESVRVDIPLASIAKVARWIGGSAPEAGPSV